MSNRKWVRGHVITYLSCGVLLSWTQTVCVRSEHCVTRLCTVPPPRYQRSLQSDDQTLAHDSAPVLHTSTARHHWSFFSPLTTTQRCLFTKRYVSYGEIGRYLCSVISQGKVVALDRWGGKWNQLSMTHRLATNYAKNYCNRTPIVKVIVENVVTSFFGTRCSQYGCVIMRSRMIERRWKKLRKTKGEKD